jgi:hypothetical protein
MFLPVSFYRFTDVNGNSVYVSTLPAQCLALLTVPKTLDSLSLSAGLTFALSFCHVCVFMICTFSKRVYAKFSIPVYK